METIRVYKSSDLEQADLTGGHCLEFIEAANTATKYLERYVGKQVTVYQVVSGSPRHSFNDQLSLCGLLEYFSKRDQFRVLVSDGCYAYFTGNAVAECGHYGNGKTFQDGSEAAIRILLK